jgi:hypothetical protein
MHLVGKGQSSQTFIPRAPIKVFHELHAPLHRNKLK